MRFLALITGFLAFLAIPSYAVQPDPDIDGFQARTFVDSHGKTMPYRLFIPEAASQGNPLPLVIYLHGMEALGRDNHRQITGMDRIGSHVWTFDWNQVEHPAFVLAPQCPLGGSWANLVTRRPSRYAYRAMEILDALQREFRIDPDRIYITGQSLGGFGTWALLGSFPDRFAAAVPVCGGGKASDAWKFAHVPLHAYHGSADMIVWPRESRRMIAAIEKAGGNPLYTEFRFGLHNIWNLAYNDPELVPWLFSQNRNHAGSGLSLRTIY